jgi:hypothetical protein
VGSDLESLIDHEREEDTEMSVHEILHGDVQYCIQCDKVEIEKRLARITKAVLAQLTWYPLTLRSGQTPEQALTNMLSLRCNGADKLMLPSAFKYSWSIVHLQAEGTETATLVAGVTYDNCIEENVEEEEADPYAAKFYYEDYRYCEAIAARVHQYWRRADNYFVTYALTHSNGPAVEGVQVDDDDDM